MQILKDRYWKDEWVEGRTGERGESYRERKVREAREQAAKGIGKTRKR
jgi:hypothetical protein